MKDLLELNLQFFAEEGNLEGDGDGVQDTDTDNTEPNAGEQGTETNGGEQDGDGENGPKEPEPKTPIDLSKFKSNSGNKNNNNRQNNNRQNSGHQDDKSRLEERIRVLEQSNTTLAASNKNLLDEVRQYKSAPNKKPVEEDSKYLELQAKLEIIEEENRLKSVDGVIEALQVKNDQTADALRDVLIKFPKAESKLYDALADTLKAHIGDVLEQQEVQLKEVRMKSVTEPRKGTAQQSTKPLTLADLRKAFEETKI